MLNRWKAASTLKKFGMVGALAIVLGAGTASALFVGYLAERARSRSATFSPVVSTAVKTASLVAEPKPRKILPKPAVKTPVAAVTEEAKSDGWVVSEAAASPSSSQISEDESLAGTVQAGGDLPGVNAYAASDNESGGGDDQFTSAIDDGAAPIPTKKPAAAKRAAEKMASLTDDGKIETVAGGEPARVGRSVTMRSAPKKGASVIGTIPGNSAITLFGCKSWCEVSFKGKRGFIYKSFLGKS